MHFWVSRIGNEITCSSLALLLKQSSLIWTRTVNKVLQLGLYWPTLFKDARRFVENRDRCQKVGNLSRKNEMPLNNILEVELFDVWGIVFMGSFLKSFRHEYILVAADYVSKWVEAIPSPTKDDMVVSKFLEKNIFSMFGVP